MIQIQKEDNIRKRITYELAKNSNFKRSKMNCNDFSTFRRCESLGSLELSQSCSGKSAKNSVYSPFSRHKLRTGIENGRGSGDGGDVGTVCEMCINYEHQLQSVQNEKLTAEKEINAQKLRVQAVQNELEREVERRVKLEEKFSEDARRASEQIAELIAKSDSDDAKISDLKRRFHGFCSSTSDSLIRFKNARDSLVRQLEDLRRENDHLLGRFIAKSAQLQDEVIDLPQKIDDLQFHCLELREKLIIATMEKERLEQQLQVSEAQQFQHLAPPSDNQQSGPLNPWNSIQ